jgi:polyferredoxin
MKNDKVNITFKDLIFIFFGMLGLGALFLLKYIYPGNSFVLKYFSGLSQFILIILYFLLLWFIDGLIRKKRVAIQRKREKSRKKA